MARQTFQVLLTLSLLSHHALCSAPTNVSNTTKEHETRRFVGWRDSPNERGTMALLWTCLSTIIVSTWTLLHLNVPGSKDGAWQKIKRKIKWMALTVLFPELTFSKAVCELQMAVDDLHSMKVMENHIRATTQWKVEFGRGSEFLYNLFQYLGFKISESPTRKREQKEEPEQELISGNKATAWTLTHSYFANMGGLALERESARYEGKYHRVTAYALAKCCAKTPHSPLLATTFGEDDIRDRSKADWLSKSIAIAQVCWLLISIIVRKSRSLPISQLEVCTAAFAVLGTATWLANWSKPKDVDRPITFRVGDFREHCDIPELYNRSPYHRLSRPYKASRSEFASWRLDPEGENWTVSDDLVRFDSRYPIVGSIMALSTAIFGGIHCLAWNAVFPTSIESIAWKATSLLTMVMPLVALAATAITARLTSRRIDTVLLALKSAFGGSAISLAAESGQQESCLPGIREFNYTEIKQLILIHNSSNTPAKEIPVLISLKCFLSSVQRLLGSELPHRYHEEFLRDWGVAMHETTDVPLRIPEAAELPDENRAYLQNSIRLMVNLIKSPERLDRTRQMVEPLGMRKDIICEYIMAITGVIYLVARLMILALALAALRKQDERIYVETWTRYLPNIS